MSIIDTRSLDVIEHLPGREGRYFHSPSMTFAHYDFSCGASIHEHSRPQEEVYAVIEGERSRAERRLFDHAWSRLCPAVSGIQ